MANTYIVRLEVDDKGAQKSIQRVESSLEKVSKKAANPGGSQQKGGGVFGQLEAQADNLDNLFGKLGGSSLAVADTFKVLRTALIGSGIGAIVVLVGELINNFDLLVTAVDGVDSSQTELLATQQKSAEVAKEQLDAVSEQENILKLQGKTEEQILKLKIQQVDAAIIAQQAAISTQKTIVDTQVEAAKRNKQIVSGIFQFLTQPLELILGVVDKIRQALGQESDLRNSLNDTVSSFVFDPEEVAAEGAATIKEQEKVLLGLQNQRAGFILQQRKGASDLAKERQAELAAEQEAMRKANEALNKAIAEANKVILAAIKKNGQEVREALAKNTDFDKMRADEALQLQLLQDSAEKEIAIADQKYIKLREQAAGNAELQAQIAEANGAEVDAINKKYADAEVVRQQTLQKTRLDLAASTIGAFAALNDSFEAKSKSQAKRQFEVNKALQIAQALIQTYQAATGAYASQLSIPSPDAPIRAAIAAGAAVVAGLAQVNNIRKTKFGDASASAPSGGGAPSLGGGGGGGASGPPAFNPVNTDFINNRPPQPILAYTLAGNVTTAQEADQKIQDQARL